jgi:hypothetical protein
MEWDLIGVAGIPEAADEISRERASHFGAGPDDARDMRLAESLTAWWERRRAESS